MMDDELRKLLERVIQNGEAIGEVYIRLDILTEKVSMVFVDLAYTLEHVKKYLNEHKEE